MSLFLSIPLRRIWIGTHARATKRTVTETLHKHHLVHPAGGTATVTQTFTPEHITVKSAPGQGSAFTVTLPRSLHPDCHEAFGWESDQKVVTADRRSLTTLRMKRDRKIINKEEDS